MILIAIQYSFILRETCPVAKKILTPRRARRRCSFVRNSNVRFFFVVLSTVTTSETLRIASNMIRSLKLSKVSIGLNSFGCLRSFESCDTVGIVYGSGRYSQTVYHWQRMFKENWETIYYIQRSRGSNFEFSTVYTEFNRFEMSRVSSSLLHRALSQVTRPISKSQSRCRTLGTCESSVRNRGNCSRVTSNIFSRRT